MGKLSNLLTFTQLVNEGAQIHSDCLVPGFMLLTTPLHALNMADTMLGALKSHLTYSSKQFPFDTVESTKAERGKVTCKDYTNSKSYN